MKTVSRSSDASVMSLIDGGLVPPLSDDRIDVTNPSTGQYAYALPAGGEADVNRAVSSARKTFVSGSWSEAAPSFRKNVLYRFADLIAKYGVELDALDAEDMGKPVSEVVCNAASAAGLVRFYAEAIDKLHGDVSNSDRHSLVVQRLVPRGVVGAVVPWNFPTYVALLKAAPALAAGNSIVLKPSELSSRSAIRLAQLAIEAGLPSGAFNVVLGLGTTSGKALARHMDVDMMTFTGSTAVGRLMLEYAGQSNLKVVRAECGGKSPQIVFADGVDLDAASLSIARAMLTNQGQICSVGSRLLVERSVEAQLIEKIAGHFSKIVMGDASDPSTTFGPIASAKQYDRVLGYIDGASSDGAQLVVGGCKALEKSGGYFVQPTIFRNVSPTARLAQEEIFGPVLSVIPFDNEAEAIQIANGTAYGLMAYVWTAQLSTGMRVAKSVRSAVVVNACAPKGEGAGYGFSFEPSGQSGVGAEGGLPGLQGYLRRQLVRFNHA